MIRNFLRKLPEGGGQLPLFPDHSADFSAGTGFLRMLGGLPVQGGTPFSIAFWFNLGNGSLAHDWFAWSQISNRSMFGDDQFYYQYDKTLGVSRGVYIGTDNAPISCGGGGDADNLWRFKVLTYDGGTGLDLWTYPGPTHSTAVMGAQLRPHANVDWIVGDAPEYGGTSDRWPGRIDSLGVWTRKLAQADTDALYNAGAGLQYVQQAPVAVQSGIYAWWSFDEPTGSPTWFDTSGNGHHLSQVGTVRSGGKRGT